MARSVLILVGALILAGCVTAGADLSVQSLPEGLEVELQGYRLFLRDVYQLQVRVRNAGDGMLYQLNGHEIMIITGREITVDGETLEIVPGERFEIASRRQAGPSEKTTPVIPDLPRPERSP